MSSTFQVTLIQVHQKYTFVGTFDAKVIILKYFCSLYWIILTLLTKKVKSLNSWVEIYKSKQEFFMQENLGIEPFTF